MKYIAFFNDIQHTDTSKFGGKNSALGQMIQDLTEQKIVIPYGFATTAEAYWYVLESNGIVDSMKLIMDELVDIHDLKLLQTVGQRIRNLIIDVSLPIDLHNEIIEAYRQLSLLYHPTELCDVAVRSSATAEDLPEASFAGQQETFLNITGYESLIQACKKSMASLFTDRAIVYRREHGFNDFDVALSVGIQKMVRSDLAVSGVLFTLDTETGFKNVVAISSSYGLGETIVQGQVNPDEFLIHKETLQKGYKPLIKKSLGSKEQKLVYDKDCVKIEPVAEYDRNQFSLSDENIFELARYGLTIENYYSQRNGFWTPMDIEWAKDGIDQKIYIVQARPETVHSQKKIATMSQYFFNTVPPKSSIIISGKNIGTGIVSGTVRIITSLDLAGEINQGDILVADMTDPDWVPLMKKAGALITNRGGRTCHAAIVSRELGLIALVGTEHATAKLVDGQKVTVDCSGGLQGHVYEGIWPFESKQTDLTGSFKPPVDLLVNIAQPDSAFGVSLLPVAGVGLARLEFIISSVIKAHPMAIIKPESIDQHSNDRIRALSVGYATPRDYYINLLAQSIGMIAGAFHPRTVCVRLTDFKTNEYRDLIGGSFFEPYEENPMIGFRGAVRYCHAEYRAAFALECEAIKIARERMGFDTIQVMIPFVRTIDEARDSIAVLEHYGLKRGEHGLQLFMMVEVPSNVILMEEFADYFDGFSIGSNDLTQLTLGIDRDSHYLSHLFDERNEAVKTIISKAISGAKKSGKYIGICGQAPSDFPDFADFLIRQGISSLSLTPDSIIPFLMRYKSQ